MELERVDQQRSMHQKKETTLTVYNNIQEQVNPYGVGQSPPLLKSTVVVVVVVMERRNRESAGRTPVVET
jgi:hypothetical protein